MTKDGILVLQCLFGNIWRLFTSWYIPGTMVTPAGFLVFLAFCGLVLRWLSRLFEIQLGASVTASHVEGMGASGHTDSEGNHSFFNPSGHRW